MNETDLAQTEALIVSLEASRTQLAEAGLDTTEIDGKIQALKDLINPPALPPPPAPESILPRKYVSATIDGKKWYYPAFYYCGGWHAAVSPSDRNWGLFVAAYGSDIANDASNRIPVDSIGDGA